MAELRWIQARLAPYTTPEPDPIIQFHRSTVAPVPLPRLCAFAVEPGTCSDVLKFLVSALEPKLIRGQALDALHAAASAPQTIEAATQMRDALLSSLPPREAELLQRLLRLLCDATEAARRPAEVEAEVAARWGPILGVPSSGIGAMHALLAAE